MRRGTKAAAAIAVVLCLPAAAMGAEGKGRGSGRITIESLSSDPDLVTGGDVLLEVHVPKSTKTSKVRIVRNGSNVPAKLSLFNSPITGPLPSSPAASRFLRRPRDREPGGTLRLPPVP